MPTMDPIGMCPGDFICGGSHKELPPQKALSAKTKGVDQLCDKFQMLVQDAIDSCPVDCIHWVDKDQLPALEYVMQRKMGRTNVGVMMAGQGGSSADVFDLTTRFLKQREER